MIFVSVFMVDCLYWFMLFFLLIIVLLLSFWLRRIKLNI